MLYVFLGVLDAPFVDCAHFRLHVFQVAWLEFLLLYIDEVLHILDSDVLYANSAVVHSFDLRL